MSSKAVHRRIVHVTVRAPRDVRVQVCIEQASDEASDEDTTDGSVAAAAPPRPLTPPFAEAPAAKPVQGLKRARPEPRALPERTYVDALMYPGLDVAALQKTFTPHTNALNAHPRDARVRTVFTSTRHEYYVDDVLCKRAEKWFSATGIIGELFKHFDAKQKAGALAAKSTNSQYTGKTSDEILGEWDQNRDDGSSKHASYDAWLQHEPLQLDPVPDPDNPGVMLPAPMLPPPMGYYRALAELTRRFDVYRTEWNVFCEDLRFNGQIDLVLRERSTGRLYLGDWKNCKNEDLTTPFGKQTGWHPFTADWSDSKMSHYKLQLNLYRSILMRKYGLDVAETLLLVNFRPEHPYEYHIYEIETIDMAPLFALMPWDVQDPRHNYFPGETLLPRVADDDPRCVGPTKRVRAPFGPLDDNTTWTGAMYPSATKRKENDANIAARKERGEAYDDLILVRDFPEFKYKHPWSWYPSPPRGATGYYERYLLNNRELIELLPWLYGRKLACFCKTDQEKCQADVLAKYANVYHGRSDIIK